jgi:hypothetical protein
VDALAELALEPVAVEQGHEKLEVLFLAVVRVAVISRKCRVRPESRRPRWCRWWRLVYLTSPPKKVADILWASSQTIRST